MFYKTITHDLSSTKWQIQIDSTYQIADKEPDISLRSWWRPKQSLKKSYYWIYIWSETWLHLNADIAPYLLDVTCYWRFEVYFWFIYIKLLVSVFHVLPELSFSSLTMYVYMSMDQCKHNREDYKIIYSPCRLSSCSYRHHIIQYHT